MLREPSFRAPPQDDGGDAGDSNDSGESETEIEGHDHDDSEGETETEPIEAARKPIMPFKGKLKGKGKGKMPAATGASPLATSVVPEEEGMCLWQLVP